MSEFNRIAISGKICSGKTTVAKMLMGKYDYTRLFFANELKRLCNDIAAYNRLVSAGAKPEECKPLVEIIWQDIQRITRTDEEYQAAIQQVLYIMAEFNHVTSSNVYDDKTDDVRKMLQKVGTEYMRWNVNSNIWVNALETAISEAASHGIERIVVDDMRYENEFEMLRKNGFVMVRLNVSRETQVRRVKKLYGTVDESKFTHTSEIALDHMPFDYVIDSDQELSNMLNDIQLMVEGDSR